MGFGGGIGSPSGAYTAAGTVDAALESNLPEIGEGLLYFISGPGTFEGSALINPAGFTFDIGDTITGNTGTGKWDAHDSSDPISQEAYTSAWASQTRGVPSKDVLNTFFAAHLSATGLNSTGGLDAYSGTNYIDAAASLKAADILLDTAAGGLQTELDATQSAVGLTSAGGLTAFSGTNYLDAITSLRAAIIELDSKIKSEAIKYAIALGG
jgi:hypothetical protein